MPRNHASSSRVQPYHIPRTFQGLLGTPNSSFTSLVGLYFPSKSPSCLLPPPPLVLTGRLRNTATANNNRPMRTIRCAHMNWRAKKPQALKTEIGCLSFLNYNFKHLRLPANVSQTTGSDCSTISSMCNTVRTALGCTVTRATKRGVACPLERRIP
ncbi:hypothetical protein CPB85DRAFT_952823 [Mucidula mucida]|nr:hypothetical protein CPB85DRAFT_952823 [Mucidula mucida]